MQTETADARKAAGDVAEVPLFVAGEVDLVSRAIMRLQKVDSRFLAQILAAYDLTIPQFYALFAIRNMGSAEGCRMGDLAHGLYQSSPTMTGIVSRLETDGLVERIMDPEDRRAVQ